MPLLHVDRRRDPPLVSGQTHYATGRRIRSGSGADDGIFAEWSWDGERLEVRTCRYGLYPLFCYADARQVWIATSLAELVAQGFEPELDDEALAVFLALGFFIADRTAFAGVRQVPPSAVLQWRDGALSLQARAADFRIDPIGRDAAIDGYIDLFRQAIARRQPSAPFALPLSGGRDSRHILLELCRAGHRPDFCITARRLPPHTNDDLEIAGSLASELSFRHVMVDPPADLVAAETRKNLLTNFCADEHGWLMPVVEYIGANADVIYDGIGGDVLSAGLFQSPEHLKLLAAGAVGAAADRIMADWGRTWRRQAAILSPAARRRFDRHAARRQVADELKAHLHHPNPLQSFYFWNRTRREIGAYTFGMHAGVRTIHCPYLDHDLFDFLMTLPPELAVQGDLHDAAIARAYPEFAHIPFDRHKAVFLRPTRGQVRQLAQDFRNYLQGCRNRSLVSNAVLDALGLAWRATGRPFGIRQMTNRAIYLLQIADLRQAVRHEKGPSRFRLSP